MEEVEEEQVQRCERAQNPAGHQQQQNVKFLFTVLDFPGDTGCGKSHNCTHQNKAHIDAVHADVIADAQRRHPGNALFELVASRPRLELQEHLNCQQRRYERGGQRHTSHHDPEVARHERQHDRGEQRPGNDVGQS